MKHLDNFIIKHQLQKTIEELKEYIEILVYVYVVMF